jgi:hypothetical protein
MAAGKKTGGRQKGTPNKVTAEREAEVAASGLTPLAYMLSILRDPKQPPDDRKWAAQQAAPYCHAKMANISVEHDASERLYDFLAGRDG